MEALKMHGEDTLRMAAEVWNADAIEAELRQNRLLNLPVDWADELIFPAYDGLSIRNIPHSAAALIGAPLANSVPLDDRVWQGESLDNGFDRVLFFLMDGMGYRYLRQLMAEDAEIAQIVADLSEGRGPIPLTSVAPSTTAVALGALWSGGTPAQTGMMGTFMWLREISVTGDMLAFAPLIARDSRLFEERGLAAEVFNPVPGLGTQLGAAGVESHLLIAYNLIGTGLSRSLHRGVTHTHGIMSYSDLRLYLNDLMRKTAGKRAFIYAYWPGVDTLGHAYGSHTVYTREEIRLRLEDIRAALNDPAVRDGRTLLMIAADHGHKDVSSIVDVIRDPQAAGIRDGMAIGMTGDHRLGILNLRDGCREQVHETIRTHYSHALAAIDSADALAAGFYGHGNHHPEASRRAGDMIIISREGWRMNDPSQGELNLVGWHGGLSDWEMLVPLIWQRL